MAVSDESLEVTTHGRYLVEAPGSGLPMLVGFHGYAESADTALERLRSIEGANGRILLAIQGLHRFYRGRTNEVVASWMTRQDRESTIADNKAYTAKVVEKVATQFSSNEPIVLAGFSQGVSMAFRCATYLTRPVHSVIALGGDVPPEIDAQSLARIPSVLLARGTQDEFYPKEKLATDEIRLRGAGVNLQVLSFEAGHEWTSEFSRAVAHFLRSPYKK